MNRAPSRRTHPDRDVLGAFFAGKLGADDVQSVEGHLRRGCIPCLFAARDEALAYSAESRGHLRDGLFGGEDSSLQRYTCWLEHKILLIELEQQLTPALLAELMLRPSEARRELVRTSRRYQVLGLAQALREESRTEVQRDVARAIELAELGVEVSDCLEPAFYGARLVQDVRALAYGILGNAHRVAGDLFGAERQLRTARTLLDSGTGAPTELAEILSLLGSLRIDQARYGDAVELLRQAETRYANARLDVQRGKTLINMARATGLRGEPAAAVEILLRALDLLDESDDAYLTFLCHHNIAAFLNDAGQGHEARAYLCQAQPWYERFSDDRGTLLRRRWLEGHIAANLGEVDAALTILQEVRSIFIEEERAFDHALVTLNLAEVLLSVGRTAEVKRLAEEMYPIFRSQEVHRQALAALVLFKQAAMTEAATVSLAQQVADYLTRARNNPYLPFEPAGD